MILLRELPSACGYTHEMTSRFRVLIYRSQAYVIYIEFLCFLLMITSSKKLWLQASETKNFQTSTQKLFWHLFKLCVNTECGCSQAASVESPKKARCSRNLGTRFIRTARFFFDVKFFDISMLSFNVKKSISTEHCLSCPTLFQIHINLNAVK